MDRKNLTIQIAVNKFDSGSWRAGCIIAEKTFIGPGAQTVTGAVCQLLVKIANGQFEDADLALEIALMGHKNAFDFLTDGEKSE